MGNQSISSRVTVVSGHDHSVTAGEAGTIVRRRLSTARGGLDVEQEAALLSLVAEVSPLPVPTVVDVIPEAQTMVLERVRGEPVLSITDLRRPAARHIGAQLGGLLAALGRLRLERVGSIVPEEPSALQDYHHEAERMCSTLRPELPVKFRKPLADFLAAPMPPPARRLRLCHNDLGAEHVFVGSSGEVVTGVIDWSDSSLSDPCLDLGLMWRDLGEAGFAAALQHLMPSADGRQDEGKGDFVARARFYATVKALEDVEYGLESGRSPYLRNATRALHRLFGGGPDAQE